MNFDLVFEKNRGVFFLAAWMMDIVDDMDPSEFLTGNSPQTYQRYILVAKFFL